MKKSLLAAACMVVVALGWSGVAHAQRIPEPIAEREVERFAELLDLTDDQRAIASTIWSVYREDYFAGPLERIRAIHARERAAIEEIRDRSEVNGENPGTLAKEFYPPIMAEMVIE